MSARRLPCTQCGEQVNVVEVVTGFVNWGAAVVDEDGTVRPAVQHMEFYKGDPIRVRAACSAEGCGHAWTLRRHFEPDAPERGTS